MKAIMVMYDTLVRNFLQPYGCEWTKTPNFTRLAQRSVCFENNYVGSLPCMPARRELHTGRYNFLHRSWGPMEPFDDSMPELLRNAGIFTHLATDHNHYWEDGGATYHTRYSAWEGSRGQEGDAWKTTLGTEIAPTAFGDGMNTLPGAKRMKEHDAMNRRYIGASEDKMPQAVTFANGLEFIENNHDKDNWFLQIETFDPHEPFFCQQPYKDLYPHAYNGLPADWPPYGVVREDAATVEHVRYEYAALLSMCDAYLGKVLNAMDAHDLWQDTMLIVNTDHGFLLGEHDWWSKSIMPIYNEIAHTPLFIYDPRSKTQGVRRQALTQTIDLPATLLEFFGQPLPPHMQGKPLRGVIEKDEPVREYGLFGYHGNYTCITDGRHVYMKAPVTMDNRPLNEYTLMPTHMRKMFSPGELQNIQLQEPFTFTKGCRVMKIEAAPEPLSAANYGTKLYDLTQDPGQCHPLEDAALEVKMARALVRLMRENEAPPEQYERLGLAADEALVTEETVTAAREKLEAARHPGILEKYHWTQGAQNMYQGIRRMVPQNMLGAAGLAFKGMLALQPGKKDITEEDLLRLVKKVVPEKQRDMALYFIQLLGRTD